MVDLSLELKHLLISAKQSDFQVAKITYQALGHSIFDPIIYDYFYQKGVIKQKALFICDFTKAANSIVLNKFGKDSQIFLHNSVASFGIESLGYLPQSIHDTSALYNNYSIPHNPPIWAAIDNYINQDSDIMSSFSPSNNIHDMYKNFLKDYGLDDCNYICIHCRQAGYKSEQLSGNQSFRNADISCLKESVEVLEKYGIKAVQMGSPGTEPLIHQNVVNYSSSRYASSTMDLLVANGSLAWLGDSSGASAYATLFRKPRILFNMPLTGCIGYSSQDLHLFMKPHLIESSTKLEIRNAFAIGVDRYSCSEKLASMGFYYQINTGNEISNAVSEYLPHIISKQHKEYITNCRSSHLFNAFYSQLRPDSYIRGAHGAIAMNLIA
ncbi:TIGR04372 family glycosyltransferase [Prochlorococcus sp. MIT 1300]|uniref:TIGR04372 family glycosyltransferase n=1 Tax=Prochlorococcus sp. MIT 1300 TaxID=3096218 RepID=UPI002A756C43|nr:TIGR04372 family glycosyltransferase [Prochlorococcus sp. MIT 1300]